MPFIWNVAILNVVVSNIVVVNRIYHQWPWILKQATPDPSMEWTSITLGETMVFPALWPPWQMMNDKILDHYISFHFEERFSIFWWIIPLLCAYDDPQSSIYKLSKDNLAKLKLKPWEFVSTFITQYHHQTKQPLPETIMQDPRTTSHAKQSIKEQVVMLEVHFWSLSEHNLHDGPLYQDIFKLDMKPTLVSVRNTWVYFFWTRRHAIV